MKNLEEFRNSKVLMTKTAYCKTYGQDPEAFSKDCYSVFVYYDIFHIESLATGKYNLIIGNQEYEDESLAQLENILWHDFAKGEIGAVDYKWEIEKLLAKYGKEFTSIDSFFLKDIPGAMSTQDAMLLVQLILKIKENE
jgi:hypothetical protein